MIAKPDWQGPKQKPHMHQISIESIQMLSEAQRMHNKGMINDTEWAETMQDVLKSEIDDPEFLSFAIDNYSELFCYISSGIRNIIVYRDIEGKIWFGVD